MCLKEQTAQAYVDGELASDRRDEVVRHLASCEECRGRISALVARRARVDALLSELRDDSRAQSAGAALAQFQARVAAERAGIGAAGARGLRMTTALEVAAAAAVLVLVAVAITLMATRTRPVTSHDQARGTVRPTTPAAQPAGPSLAEGGGLRAAVVPARPSISRRPRASRRVVATSPYYLLTQDVAPSEVGVVVRVRMRLSALTPRLMAESRANAGPEVEADVLVGEDGRARAIRFVNQTPQTTGGK